MKSHSNSPLARLWRHQWAVVGGLAFAAFFLGIVGLWRLRAQDTCPKPWVWADAIYFSLRLFGFNYDLGGDGTDPYAAGNWQLWVARFLAPASTALAVVKAVTQKASRQFVLWQVSRWKGHAVIFGAGERGRRLALSLRQGRGRVVVVEKNGSCETLDELRKNGVKVIVGSVTDPAIQSAARLDSAATVVSLTPCPESNLRVVLAARELHQTRDGKLPVHALAYAPRPFAAIFEGHPDFRQIKQGVQCGFFDDNASAARVLVSRYMQRIARQVFLDNRGARILVAGDGEILPELLGVLIALSQIASPTLPRITLLTVSEDVIARGFPLHHPGLPLVVHLHDEEMPLARMMMAPLPGSNPGGDSEPCDLVFVACREDADSLALATHFAQQSGQATTVVACLAPSTSLHRLFEGALRIPGVDIVNLVELGCEVEQVLRGSLDEKARSIHEAYYRSETANGNADGAWLSLHKWEDLREDFRQGNRSQADHIPIKRAILDVSDTPDTIESLAEAEHRRWMADRIFCGWRYSAVREDEKKLHDRIVPYDDLPDENKKKDRATVRTAQADV
ncbi:MAG: NAD-binding protein [Gemmataceae bacterium]